MPGRLYRCGKFYALCSGASRGWLQTDVQVLSSQNLVGLLYVFILKQLLQNQFKGILRNKGRHLF